MLLPFEEKSPEDLLALRVKGAVRVLPVAGAVVRSPTARAVAVAVITKVAVARRRIRVRPGPVHRNGLVNDHRCRRHEDGGIDDGRRTRRGDDHRRRTPDRGGHPNRDVHRPTGLGGSGKSRDGNRGHQSEQIFCFHERFDAVFRRLFRKSKRRDYIRVQSVRKKGGGNE